MEAVSVADSLSERESEKLRENVSLKLRVGESDAVGSDTETEVDSVSSRGIVGTAVSVSSCVADSDAVRCVIESVADTEVERLVEGLAVADADALSLNVLEVDAVGEAENDVEAESVVDGAEELDRERLAL